MSARGGQWIAAGALVVVGVGIILYLTKKRKKTDTAPSKLHRFPLLKEYDKEDARSIGLRYTFNGFINRNRNGNVKLRILLT